MNSRKPSLLSNSGPPRRADALPNRPNCMVSPLCCRVLRFWHCRRSAAHHLVSASMRCRHGLAGPFPAEPVADGIPHHQLLVAPLEPGQLFREHRHALSVRARHAGDVGAPKAALRPEGVKDLAEILVDVAVGIGMTRIAWRARE